MSTDIHTARMADYHARKARASLLPLPTVAHSHAVEHILYPDFPADPGPRVCHPDLGWGTVVMVNDHEFRLRFDAVFAWFNLSCPTVALWPVENAVSLARWVSRAA